ncbi:MAG TPA: hypothetical protein VNM90_16105, partial [Haliangium sp.]|nr:hypothetical protein [Haliangium sp.]
MRITEHHRPYSSISSMFTFLAAILLASALAGCGGGGDSTPPDAFVPDATPPGPDVSEVQALFDRDCGGSFCHIGSSNPAGGLDLTPG